MTYNYPRINTITLFAALNVLDSKMIGACLSRHRHSEFLRILGWANRQIPNDLHIHTLLETYATHKHDPIELWLKTYLQFQ